MDLEERILAQQRDDDSSRLIEEYMPFIASCARKHAGWRTHPSQDEMAVAMSAFHEAMQSFDGRKGRFLPYARLVIRNRLIDAARSSAAVREIPFSALGTGDEGERDPFEVEDHRQQNQMDIAQEIDALSAELLALGVRFDDLAAASPRSGKTRKACATVVRALLANPIALENLMATGRLPAAFLSKSCNLSPKLLGRHRKYIIAATVILANDYPRLREYVSYIGE